MLQRVFRGRKDGFYIDVGAMDPVIESVTKFFYDEGWSGINIEPNEWFYGKLLQERPRDINLNLALGEREERRELYLFERIGNSTFEESSRDRYVERGFEAKNVPVKVTTLASVCRDYVRRPIDFLKVDCEGWEQFVIKGADWDRFRPTVLIIEATEPGTEIPSWEEWEPYLIENARYEMVYFDGLNRFYLQRESLDLRSHFELPPNFHDQFRLYAVEAAEQTIHALQWHRDTLTAQVAELEQALNSATAEHLRIAEFLANKEAEIRCTQDSLAGTEQERDSLARRLVELEPQAAREREQVVQLAKERQELQEMLLKTRLWVGRLSQELSASKRRQ